MNLMQKIFGAREKAITGTWNPIIGTGTNSFGPTPRPSIHNMGDYLGRFADQAWLYACIRVIQTKGAGVPLKVYRWDAKTRKAVEVADHPLQILLDKPNPIMSGNDLREATLGFYDLSGNAYWLQNRIVDGKPLELWPLNPSRIEIKADPVKYITAYDYRVNGKVVKTFKPEEVDHFKTWNPLDDFYGLSPIAAARDASDTMMFADRYNRAFFENSAEPGGVLTSDANVSEENAKRMLSIWESVHRSVRKAFKTAFLSNGVKYQQISSSHRDMMFPELKKMTRQDVLTVFNIPPIMVGIDEEASYNNATIQERIFWKNCMIPRLQKIDSVINARLAPKYGPDIYVAHDLAGIEALQEDEKMRAETEAIHTQAGIRTINEVRTERNLDPVAWGDTWNAPTSVMPIEQPRVTFGGLPPAPPPTDEPEDDEQEEESNEDEDKSFAPIEKESVTGTSGESGFLPIKTLEVRDEDPGKIRRDNVWARFKTNTESIERRWIVGLRKLFSGQEREVINNVQNQWEKTYKQLNLNQFQGIQTKLAVFLFDRGAWRKVFQKDGRALLTLAFKEAFEDQAKENNLDVDFDLNNPRVTTWIQNKAFKFADEINQTTEDALRTQLEEAIKAGESISDVEKRIEQVFDIARGARSEMIARTEVISASNKGAVEAYEESGVVEALEWISSRDNEVRKSHQIDGDETPIGVRFKNGLFYPGDPDGPADEVINCRCTTAPVIRRD